MAGWRRPQAAAAPATSPGIGRPKAAAQRPPPSRADARVVLDLVRAGRLLLYRAGDEAGEGLDARLVHAATGLGD